MGIVYQALTQALRNSVETKKKSEMEFRLCLILSLCLMANGLPNKMKTGAQIRASDNIDTTSLRSGDQSANFASTSFPVRLIHGASGIVGGKSGRLEIHIDGQWGTVRDNYSDKGDDQPNNNVALVVCRMLGFAGGKAVVSNQDQQFGKFRADTQLATNVQCQGNEVDISDCQMKCLGKGDRVSLSYRDQDHGIVCE